MALRWTQRHPTFPRQSRKNLLRSKTCSQRRFKRTVGIGAIIGLTLSWPCRWPAREAARSCAPTRPSSRSPRARRPRCSSCWPTRRTPTGSTSRDLRPAGGRGGGRGPGRGRRPDDARRLSAARLRGAQCGRQREGHAALRADPGQPDRACHRHGGHLHRAVPREGRPARRR